MERMAGDGSDASTSTPPHISHDQPSPLAHATSSNLVTVPKYIPWEPSPAAVEAYSPVVLSAVLASGGHSGGKRKGRVVRHRQPVERVVSMRENERYTATSDLDMHRLHTPPLKRYSKAVVVSRSSVDRSGHGDQISQVDEKDGELVIGGHRHFSQDSTASSPPHLPSTMFPLHIKTTHLLQPHQPTPLQPHHTTPLLQPHQLTPLQPHHTTSLQPHHTMPLQPHHTTSAPTNNMLHLSTAGHGFGRQHVGQGEGSIVRRGFVGEGSWSGPEGASDTSRSSTPMREGEEADSLYHQLQIQMEVNEELKRLLVGAVGDDAQHRLDSLLQTKTRMRRRLLESSAHSYQLVEEVERLAIQCDVYRSKFLAMKTMTSELTSLKSCLIKRLSLTQLALQDMLSEHETLRKNMAETYRHLYSLVEQGEREGFTAESLNLLHLSSACHSIASYLTASSSSSSPSNQSVAGGAIEKDVDTFHDVIPPAASSTHTSAGCPTTTVSNNTLVPSPPSLTSLSSAIVSSEHSKKSLVSRCQETETAGEKQAIQLLTCPIEPNQPLSVMKDMIERFHPNSNADLTNISCCYTCKGEVKDV